MEAKKDKLDAELRIANEISHRIVQISNLETENLRLKKELSEAKDELTSVKASAISTQRNVRFKIRSIFIEGTHF